MKFSRQSLRVFAALKILVGHHHSALLPHPTAPVDFKLRHRLTQQVDYCTLRRNQLKTPQPSAPSDTYGIIKLAFHLLNQRDDLLVTSRLDGLVGDVPNAEVIAVKSRELTAR